MYLVNSCIHEQKEGVVLATKAHLEGNKRYLEKQDNIQLRVPKGKKALIQDYAKSIGKSLNSYIVDLVDTDMAKVAPAPVRTKIIPLLGGSFAAGKGEPDFGNPWEDYEIPVDTKADFAIRINGDSMEPYLPDGSIALCKKANPKDGDVCALLVDGQFLVKQACEDFMGNLYLFSLNRNRSDADMTIRHNSDQTVSCFGVVIMEPVALPR